MKKQIIIFFFFVLWSSQQLNAQEYSDSAIFCKTCLVKFPIIFDDQMYNLLSNEFFFIEDKSNFYKNKNIIINYDTLNNQGSICGVLDSSEFSYNFQISKELTEIYTNRIIDALPFIGIYNQLPFFSSNSYHTKEQFSSIIFNPIYEKHISELKAIEKQVINKHLEEASELSDIENSDPNYEIYEDVLFIKWFDSIRYIELKKTFKDSLSYAEYFKTLNSKIENGYNLSTYKGILNGEYKITWKNQPITQVISHWKQGIINGQYTYIENGCEYGGNYIDGVKDGHWLTLDYHNKSNQTSNFEQEIIDENWDKGKLVGNWSLKTLGHKFGGYYKNGIKVGEWKILFYRDTIPHYFKINFDSTGQIICLEAFQLENSIKIYDVIFSSKLFFSDSIQRISTYIKTDYDFEGKILKVRKGKFLKETVIVSRDPYYISRPQEEISANFNIKLSWDDTGILKEEGSLNQNKKVKSRFRLFVEY